MAILIVIICILLIVVGLALFVRELRRIAKGTCCESCKGCRQSESCQNQQKPPTEQP